MKSRTNEQLAMHVSRVTILWNAALSAFKFFAGLFAHSGAMLSDAVHSASDVFSTVIVMIGVRLSHKEADHDHQYGHERMECVAALLLAALLLATGLGICYSGVRKIMGAGAALVIPGRLALIAAVISIVVKETMYWYTRTAAHAIRSGALMADAWHHRSDALSSVGSFAGILGARLGFPVLDPIAGIAISIFIIKAAVDIFRDSIGKMTDRACDAQTFAGLQREIAGLDGVLGIDDLHTRLFGDRIYVDVEIRADGRAPLYEAHAIAQQVHDRVEQGFPLVKHCMVHVNPEPTDAGATGSSTPPEQYHTS
ncbi:MAG: cation diffusion facilitator family transporter [Intestinibacillus sp.]